jgi:predicted nuclease of predicted toxin-antitoxin system
VVSAVKLDENVPDSVGTILREAGHDVAFARDEQFAGVPDDRLLTAATGEGRVLVSFDRGFANVIQHPPAATAGIVVIRLGEQTLPRVRQVAAILAGLLTTERIAGRLWVLTESRLRIWPRGPG